MSDDVDIGIILRTEGQKLVYELQKQMEGLRAEVSLLTAASKANASALAGQTTVMNAQLAALNKMAAANQKAAQATDSFSAGVKSLAKSVLAAAAAFAGFQGFRAFISEGLEFNSTIETANLGIASLITAQSKLRDEQGNLLTGTAALRGAQELATDQVNKLRIAGLQTTATTQELVVAFQQAVGVGLRWGLTLDQIRKLTIQMSQAAGALGLPMNQLNEEVRDLLGGNINARNTRIATALGITNEQIKQAQTAGKLFDFVTGRLEAFSIAGEATAKTFTGVMSNVKEALQNLAGDATKPLFDALKTSGQAALEGVFDLDNARISDKFAGVVEIAQRMFAGIGGLLADAISGAVEGAQKFSGWLEDNKDLVNDIFMVVGEIVNQFKGLIGDVAAVAGGLLKSGTEAGILNLALRGVGVFVAGIRDGLRAILGIVGAIGALVINAILRPFSEFLEITAKVAGFFDKELGASLKGTSEDIDAFVKEINEGVAGIFDPFVEGTSAVQQATAKFAEMEKAGDKVVKKNKEVAASMSKITITPNSTGQETTTKGGPAKEAAAQTILAKAELANRLKDLKIELDNERISYRKYYDDVTAAQQTAIDKQIAAQKGLLAATTGNEARDKILADIKKLEGERAQVVEDNAEKRRVAEEKLNAEVAAAQVTLLKDQGKLAEARALEVETKFKELVARLKAEGNTAGVEIVTALFNIDNAKTRLTELGNQAKTIQDTLSVKLSAIKTDKDQDVITEAESRERIVQAYKDAKTALEALLPLMMEQALITGDPEQLANVEQLRIKIAEMGVTIKETGDKLKELKSGARAAFESGLGQFLDDAAAGAKSLKDAWKDAARAVIASLRQIATQMLANLIIQQSLKLFGFSGGGAVGAVRKASGGYIRGPGTSRSDSIPAWLSNGEYVVQARAVSAVGVDFLNEINSLGRASVRSRPRAGRFADGGLVAQTSNDPGVSGRLTVGLEDGLVLRHLESSAGQTVLLDFVERNQNKLRRMLGGNS